MPASASHSARSSTGAGLIAVAVVCVAIGTVAPWRAKPQTSDVEFGSVAVLPFLSDSPGNNYLADGLTEATVNGLVQLQALRVAPRTNALRYKGSAVRPKDA